MASILSRLPAPAKARLARFAEALGSWPLKIRAGPARGLVLFAPLTRRLQYAGGDYERPVAEALWEGLKPGMVALDAGAHLGYLTLLSINPLVDLYNVVSLRHLLPVGGEDLEKVTGPIFLTFAGDDEPPVPLLGERRERPPYPGEVIYRDGVGAICRRWNWKEADRTKLTPGTRDAVLVIEALPPAGEAEVIAALEDLAGLIERFCGGQCSQHLLGPDNARVDLDA